MQTITPGIFDRFSSGKAVYKEIYDIVYDRIVCELAELERKSNITFLLNYHFYY